MTRRSVRSFEDKKIGKDDLNTIALSAINAPSARNQQCWKFTVLQDKAFMKKLASVIAEATDRDSGYDFYSPDALIIVSSESSYEYNREDCACALENIFLSAHALGIGSVWINQLNGICGNPAVRSVLDELHIPQSHNVYGMAALGYQKGETKRMVKNSSVIEFII